MAKYIIQEKMTKRFIGDNGKTRDKHQAKIFNSKEEAASFISPIRNEELLKHYILYKIRISIDNRVGW